MSARGRLTSHGRSIALVCLLAAGSLLAVGGVHIQQSPSMTAS